MSDRKEKTAESLIRKRVPQESNRVSLFISILFHALFIFGVFFLAAREGVLGKRLKQMTVVLVPKDEKPKPPEEKPKEPPREKPPEIKPKPKADIPKPALAKVAPLAPRLTVPPSVFVPSAAPPPAISSTFDFSDGAKVVQTSDDPVVVYKSYVENVLRSQWSRPVEGSDLDYMAEVEVAIDSSGRVLGNVWRKGSGNSRWDDSVRRALAQTASIRRPPPMGFPDKFVVRFDVQQDSEPVGIQ